MLNVIINGARGRMGLTTVNSIANEPDLKLVACLNRGDNLATAIKDHQADVVVDFTLPDCVFANTQTIIENNARPVIGTSGLTTEQITALQNKCADEKIGGVIAPNFSLGAILMMRYAQDAIKYLPNAEIIEMHHALKIDAPSGTAVKTAALMAAARNQAAKPATPELPARGELHDDIPIHSLRLSGLFANQMVMFGGTGETLTIRHDATDRNSMMPGVFLACRKVMELDQLIYGLENLID